MRIFTTLVLMFVITISRAQTTAMQFVDMDCNGNTNDLFADLDAGKAVILEFYMSNCASCPPPAQKIQKMANKILTTHPGRIKAYAIPYENTTTCSYSASWVTNNNLTLFTPMDSGAAQVAYYGGFGMPTIVLLGGADHKVLWSTLSFSTGDTTVMRDHILALLGNVTGINYAVEPVKSFAVFPNPAADKITVDLQLNLVSEVMIDVMDITGKQVKVLVTEKQNGAFTKELSTASLPNGLYFVRLQVNGESQTRKITIIH